ncbi:hypothetical protein B0J14DRAFT_678618 [Halenospora varia]|nr:hypothetical protein B0J14DRAFT_678618 [Halenospora varia]
MGFFIQGDAPAQVRGFAILIAAVVDGRDGKPVELVGRGIPRDSSGDFGLEPGKPAQEAYFERIQFKTATANNGKRRATQQYYRLFVELFADLGPQSADPWVKVALRMSPPLVVRSRNPGHYASQGARDSYTPYGSMMLGGEGTGAYGSKAARSTDDMTMSASSSMLSGFDRSPSYDTSSYPSRAQDPILPMLKNLPSLSDMTMTGSLSMPPGYSRSLPHNTSSRPSRAQVSNVLISKNLPSPGAANNKGISESKTVMSERLESSREQKQGKTEVAKAEVAISKPLKGGQAAPLLSKHWPRDNLKSSHLPPPVRHVSEQAPAREVPELSERKRGFHEVKSDVVSRSEARTKNSSTCHVPAGHKEVQKKNEDIEFPDSMLPGLSLSPFVGEGSSKMDVESVVDLDSVLESTTVTQSCKRQTTSLTKTLKNMLKTFFRPSHQVGYRRVEWTCGCGETLYADFQNGSSDAVKRLAAIIQSLNSPDTREAPAARIPIYEMDTQISRQPPASSSTSLNRR